MVDPYDWLGVPKAQRPPTHYQLLGLSPARADDDAIRSATDARLVRLDPHLVGPHALSAERLRAELEEARDTLLDTERRRLYDILAPDAEGPEPETQVEPDPEPIPASWWDGPKPDDVPSSVEPWWDGAKPELPAPEPEPWWKGAPPVDVPSPPPTLPMPRANSPTVSATETEEPPARRANPIPIVAACLAGALLIGAGAFFFIRKLSNDSQPDSVVAHNGPPVDPGPAAIAKLPDVPAKIEPEPEPIPPKKEPEPKKKPVAPPKKFDVKLPPIVIAKAAPEPVARRYRGHLAAALGVASLGDGKKFVSLSADKAVRLWEADGNESTVLHTFLSPGVALSGYGDNFAACDGLTVTLFEGRKGTAIKSLESPRGGVRSLAVSADGSIVLTGLNDGFLRVWTVETSKFDEWQVATGGVDAIAVSPDGKTAYVGSGDGSVTAWQIIGHKKLFQWLPHKKGTLALQFSPDGARLATTGVDGAASIYDPTARRELARMAGHTGPVVGVAWTPDGKHVATTSIDGTLRLWSADTGKPARLTHDLEGKGQCVAIDRDGRFALAGSVSGQVHRVPLPRAKAAQSFNAPAEPLAQPESDHVAAVRSELRKRAVPATPLDQVALADAMVQAACGPDIETAVRFAMFEEARALAIKADNADATLRSIDALAAWFDVDDLPIRATALGELAGKANPASRCEAVLATLDRAEHEQRPEIVGRLLALARGLTALSPDLIRRVSAAQVRADALAAEITLVRAATAILKANPEDPSANMTCGRYLCFGRQDWTSGLAYLAKCGNPALKETAKVDYVGPKELATQLKLADDWYARAVATAEPRARHAILIRARHWCEIALNGKLDATATKNAQARLEAINKLDIEPSDPNAVPLLTPIVQRRGYDSLAQGVRANEWAIEGDCSPAGDGLKLGTGESALRSLFEIVPGTRITFDLTPDGRDIRIVCAGQDLTVPGVGKSLRLTVEFTGEELRVSATAEGAEPVVRMAPVPPAQRGPNVVTLRLSGPGPGTILSSALVRGPIRPAVPKPE